MIMGYSAMGERMIENCVPVVENITTVTVSNAVFDDLYGTRIDESIKPSGQIIPPSEWDEETYFHAKFNGTVYCGNVDFGVNNTTNILIKRRKKGEFKWFPLFDIPANKAEDYDFTVIDPYAPQGDLEYAGVPIINGYEGSYNITDVNYNFDGIMLIEKDEIVQTILDISITEDKATQIGMVNTIDSVYPYIFRNGNNNYFTGTLSATYIDLSNCIIPDKDSMHTHYQHVMEFLNDGKPKILKCDDGRIRLISVTTPPNDSNSEHWDKHTISFGYTEIGNVYSNEDMNNFGFLDLGEEWWVK